MNNIEELMTELARSSVDLKKKLYRRDEAAATTPEGADGPLIEVHTCRVCWRSAAGKGAQVRHEPNCALARLQRAQAAIRQAWPELFISKLALAAPAASTELVVAAEAPAASIPEGPGVCVHSGGSGVPDKSAHGLVTARLASISAAE